MQQKKIRLSSLRFVCIVLIVVGVALRFTNLDTKVYWHDEVYTVFRAAGYTRMEIDQALFQNRLLPAAELLKFEEIKPGSTPVDTVRSLAVEDPQHPPLYFLATRFWMQVFGNSIAAVRSLPALLSLLGLPLMYLLAIELFESPIAAWISTVLLALSPFDILFAQTARQYSLLTAVTILSSWLLLRAMRIRHWRSWVWFGLSCAMGLYTHPFFALGTLAQGVYVLLMSVGEVRSKRTSQAITSQAITSQAIKGWLGLSLVGFLGAIALALFLYLPWIGVLLGNSGRAFATTNWTKVSPGFLYLLKLWMLSFTSLFFDLDFGFDNPVTYFVRLPIVFMIGLAFYRTIQHTSRSTGLFLLTSAFIPFLVLALPDVILGGKRSAVSRYLISCFPAVQLAVGFWLSLQVQNLRSIWQKGAIALLLAGSLISVSISAGAESWWNRDLSYFNAETARRMNGFTTPIVISDIGDDFTNTGDLISLSHRLNPDVQYLLFGSSPDLTMIPPSGTPPVLAFRPTEALQKQLEQEGWTLERVFDQERLLQVSKSAITSATFKKSEVTNAAIFGTDGAVGH
jgi:uncharacterized membrane protein